MPNNFPDVTTNREVFNWLIGRDVNEVERIVNLWNSFAKDTDLPDEQYLSFAKTN